MSCDAYSSVHRYIMRNPSSSFFSIFSQQSILKKALALLALMALFFGMISALSYAARAHAYDGPIEVLDGMDSLEGEGLIIDDSGMIVGDSFGIPSNGTELEITGIEEDMIHTAPGGGFEQGFKWVFQVTVPESDSFFRMKFNDLVHEGGQDMIEAARNVRISSLQSDNVVPAIITEAGGYSEPLHIVSDIDPELPGKQIAVKVEIQIPPRSAEGSYSSGYFIESFE